jgi:hypothetical protein
VGGSAPGRPVRVAPGAGPGAPRLGVRAAAGPLAPGVASGSGVAWAAARSVGLRRLEEVRARSGSSTAYGAASTRSSSSCPAPWLRRRPVASGALRRRDLPQLQQSPIDRRDLLDGLPITTVVVDPELDRGSQVDRHGDLPGAPSWKAGGDAQQDVTALLRVTATTARLSTADLAV